MKKIVISVSCTLLVVLIVFFSVFAYWFSQNSMYIQDYKRSLRHSTSKDDLKPFYKPSVYYSKEPEESDIKYAQAHTPDIYFRSYFAAHVTFILDYKNQHTRGGYAFKINKMFVKNAKVYNRSITLRSNHPNFSYYTDYEKLMFHYGIEYEEGKDYIILFSRRFNDSKPNEYNDESFDFCMLDNSVVFIPLDEEYPYMEVYPGPNRYDATYFGASTKDVSKEEFVELVSKYAMERVKLSYEEKRDFIVIA